jgi:predicted metal-dependent phosphoesterase TrpH
MRKFRADLHIHSCLSPCADLDMSPKRIVERAVEEQLDIIALCDHNSAENVEASMRAGMQHGLRVLPGMEINTREEVHTLAIFETASQALAMQEIIYQRMRGTNRPDVFGDQVIANEFDEVEGFNDRLLIGAVNLGFRDVIKEVRRLGGLTIASHVDRPSYSLLSQLGFIPPDVDLDALEIFHKNKREEMCRDVPGMRDLPLVSSSDAHFLSDIGRSHTVFFLEAPSVEEIRMAFSGKSGRRVEH